MCTKLCTLFRVFETGVLCGSILPFSLNHTIANGQYIPPLIIYPRKNLKMEFTEGAPPGSIFACQDNGWINSDLFMKWFEHFVACVNPSVDKKVLLILDGHASHTQNIDVIVRARAKGVTMLSLPPHCTHRLQPLDVT